MACKHAQNMMCLQPPENDSCESTHSEQCGQEIVHKLANPPFKRSATSPFQAQQLGQICLANCKSIAVEMSCMLQHSPSPFGTLMEVRVSVWLFARFAGGPIFLGEPSQKLDSTCQVRAASTHGQTNQLIHFHCLLVGCFKNFLEELRRNFARYC